MLRSLTLTPVVAFSVASMLEVSSGRAWTARSRIVMQQEALVVLVLSVAWLVFLPLPTLAVQFQTATPMNPLQISQELPDTKPEILAVWLDEMQIVPSTIVMPLDRLISHKISAILVGWLDLTLVVSSQKVIPMLL